MIERGEYKGHPVLIIKRSADDKYPFTFGLHKAQLIVENSDEIRKFIEECGDEETDGAPAVPEHVKHAPHASHAAHSAHCMRSEHKGIMGHMALSGAEAETMAKILALKAYCICDAEAINEDRIVRMEQEIAASGADIADGTDALYHQLFFLLILAEMRRESDPIPLREKCYETSQLLAKAGKGDPYKVYMQIVDYMTSRQSVTQFGDFTSETRSEEPDHTTNELAAYIDLAMAHLPYGLRDFLLNESLDGILRNHSYKA
jgi:hypothetical protein